MSRNRARAVRAFAVTCFLLAGFGVGTLPMTMVSPKWLSFYIDCEDGCRPKPAPLDQLSPEVRHIVASVPRAQERMVAAMAEPHWRWRLFGIKMLDALPFVFLFFSVGMALWRFSDRQEHRDWNGIAWLQRAAGAGVVLALSAPLAQILCDAVFLAAVTDTGAFSYTIELTEVANHLLFAGAAWAAIWALAAGLRARGDLAEIV